MLSHFLHGFPPVSSGLPKCYFHRAVQTPLGSLQMVQRFILLIAVRLDLTPVMDTVPFVC